MIKVSIKDTYRGCYGNRCRQSVPVLHQTLHLLFVEDGLALAVFCRHALLAQFGVDEGRNKMDQFHLWWSECDHSSEKKLRWRSFFSNGTWRRPPISRSSRRWNLHLLPLRSWCGRTIAQHSVVKIAFNISENERRTINTNHLTAFTVSLQYTVKLMLFRG